MNLMTPDILDKLRQWLADDTVKYFYWLKEWRIIRKVRRKIDNNECQRCKQTGRHSPAEMVHHIKEVRAYPELALTLSNTESLCNACHNREHPEKLQKYKIKKFDNIERW